MIFLDSCLWAETNHIATTPKSAQNKEVASQKSIIPPKTASSERKAPIRPQPQHPQFKQTRTIEGQFVRVISRFGPHYPIRLLDKKISE